MNELYLLFYPKTKIYLHFGTFFFCRGYSKSMCYDINSEYSNNLMHSTIVCVCVCDCERQIFEIIMLGGDIPTYCQKQVTTKRTSQNQRDVTHDKKSCALGMVSGLISKSCVYKKRC